MLAHQEFATADKGGLQNVPEEQEQKGLLSFEMVKGLEARGWDRGVVAAAILRRGGEYETKMVCQPSFPFIVNGRKANF